ncbi:MAG: FadR/GntR family transcriptional regulator [Streptosporangiaceae bacterium]
MDGEDHRRSRPAYEGLADKLRLRILSGELKPGDRLPVEPELSAQYGVSRSTAREALRVLSSQNLVTTTRGVAGGSFVVHPDGQQISDYLEASLTLLTTSGSAEITVAALLEVRDILEVPAAALAAERRSEEQLAALRGTLVDPRTVESPDIYPVNRDFHTALLEASQNPLLEVVTRPVFRVLSGRFIRDVAPATFWARVYGDHREILSHIEDRDREGARASTHEHLLHLRSTYEEIDRERGR